MQYIMYRFWKFGFGTNTVYLRERDICIKMQFNYITFPNYVVILYSLSVSFNIPQVCYLLTVLKWRITVDKLPLPSNASL